MKQTEKSEFWNNKILEWEKARYGDNNQAPSWLASLVKRSSPSLRYRMELAAQMLRPHLRGKVLLDVGTGSGLLIQKLADSNASGFIGVDIAPSGIGKAREKAKAHAYADRSTFLVGSISDDLKLPHFDIVSALGLLDWLTEDEIESFFSKIQDKYFFVSYSEYRQASIQQWIHRLYVQLAYGWRTGAYVPQYHYTGWLISIAEKYGFINVKVYSSTRLAFGAILHNLPD